MTTDPPGLQITVDSTIYTSPQTYSDWFLGSSHTLSVPSPQSGTSGTRYVFSSWSDGLAQVHTIETPSTSATYTATFSTQYSLATTANPTAGGTVNPSGTNWYNSGQSVSISATPNAGYTFSNWSGDLTGTANPASIGMTGPKTVTANFCAIPETPSNPSLSNGAAGVSASPILNWTAPASADSYDVYFGITNPPTIKVSTTTAATYSPPSLSSRTTYYWQIVAKNNCGNSTAGPVWSFTTASLEITPQEGTVGTIVKIKGNGFGPSKGKAFIGSIGLSILTWDNTEIEGSLPRGLPPGAYRLTVQPKTKGSQSIIRADLFTIRPPEIDPESTDFGSPGQKIAINGKFFGSKKGKVTIGKRACNVTSWVMDLTTGASAIEFVVPKGLKKGAYDLKVINTVGEDTASFTIN